MNKQQLAAKIWASANEMRSKIEASEYKDYILGFIFYKFLSEKEEEYLRSQGSDTQDMKKVSEENPDIVKYIQGNIGYFIAYENLYSTWLASGSDFDVSNVTDALSAFSRLVNPKHRHVFERIFETLETGLSKLGETSGARTKAISGLLQLIRDIPMDSRQGYDVLGYIYEYLISNFAANAGKKAGEFYTPHEVSLLMSEIVADHLRGRSEIQIYDPTSGSGSLLINIGQAVARRNGHKDSIKYYAQELKENTYNLTRMNLIMRGVKASNIIVRNGDTLEDDWPYFEEGHPETYEPLFVDAVVSNPPYSQRWDPSDKDVDPRFNGFGIAPKSKADYAFLLHDLYHLQPDGIMTIVLPHGVLFRGGEEGNIRKGLVEKGHIDAIIGLPANIFFGTGIPTIVMVLKKRRERSDVLIIDASKGFVKEGKNNKLRASDIRRIMDAYTGRVDVDGFARVVSLEEIRANDYNLNIPRYVDSSERGEAWDIYSTMFGGIPKGEVDGLAPYWSAFSSLRGKLFDESGVVAQVRGDVRQIIESSSDVASFKQRFDDAFWDLDGFLHDELFADFSLVNRNTVEEKLADGIFERLEGIPLVDRYVAYQDLDDAWQSIGVDLEILQTEGFDSVRAVDPNMVVKKNTEVQDGWVGRLIPFELAQRVLLAEDYSDVQLCDSRLVEIASRLSSLIEDFSEEEKIGELKDALNANNDAFVKKGVETTLDEMSLDFSNPEIAKLEEYLILRKKAEKLDFIAAHPHVSWKAMEMNKDGTYSPAKVRSHIAQLRRSMPYEKDSLFARLVEASNLLAEQTLLKADAKKKKELLTERTKECIESLSDEEALTLLNEKWIVPLAHQLRRLPEVAITDFEAKVAALATKYKETYSDIDSQIRETETELAGMLGQLVGSDNDMDGLAEFISMLGGE